MDQPSNKKDKGLPLTEPASWGRLFNPVLNKLCELDFQSDPEQYNIIDMPTPERLSVALSYRGTPLPPCAQPGQQLQRGDPLTYPVKGDAGDASIPAIKSPVTGVVGSLAEASQTSPALVTLRVSAPHETLDTREQHWQLPDRDEGWNILRESAIQGHGGGGFLLAQKCNEATHTLLINAVECEPLISCDAALIHQESLRCVQGILSLMHLTRCKQCTVAVEQGNEWQIRNLQQAQEQALEQALAKPPANRHTGHTGHTGNNGESHSYVSQLKERISFVSVADVYPQGAEAILYRTVLGHTLPSGTHPADHGVCCINIATCHALNHLLSNNQPPGTRIVTLTGDAMKQSQWQRPVNLRVPLGTSIKHLLEFAGLGACEPRSLRLIRGGPVCGTELTDPETPVSMATNCIVVTQVEATPQNANCIRCGECAKYCPVDLLPQELYKAANSNDPDELNDLDIDRCLECGCCDMVCPSRIPLTQLFRETRKQRTTEHKRQASASASLQRYESRQQRLALREKKREEARENRRKAANSRTQTKQAIADALARSRRNKSK